jgi:hypothetical protein
MHNECRRGQRPRHHDQVPATHNERCCGQRLGGTIQYLRCTTSAAAGNGLCTTINYLRGAADIGLGTTTKYLRRTTSAAANSSLGTTIKYLVNQNAGGENNWVKVQVRKSWTRIQMHPLVV